MRSDRSLARMAELAAFSDDRLTHLAAQHGAGYRTASPFPHVVIDDLFPPPALQAVLDEFPGASAIDWQRYQDGTGRKLATSDRAHMGVRTQWFLDQLNSPAFIAFLQSLTGIDGLIPDPQFAGGGLHQIERGGFLKIHADFNKHPSRPLDRRLNVLVYLNHDWREEFGGHLQLWSPDMARCERRVLPVFNRCVVFSTNDLSYHGHPDPLTCPRGWSRKSIALYYYSQGRPDDEVSHRHSTLYRKRPGEQVYSVTKLARALVHRVVAASARLRSRDA